jgi:prepilin-type N-terminal cleavage/methylation domain-containing protein
VCPKSLSERDSQSGFTLVELLVVISIIGVLAAAVVPNLVDNVRQGRIAATVKDGLCLQSALQNFAAKYPEAPAPPEMSTYAEVSAFGRANGCYLPAETEAIYRTRPWVLYPTWCTRLVDGRMNRTACPSWPPFPWPSGSQPLPFSGPVPFDSAVATGAEIVLKTAGVPGTLQGSAVLVSPDRGVVKLTLADLRQVQTELQ